MQHTEPHPGCLPAGLGARLVGIVVLLIAGPACTPDETVVTGSVASADCQGGACDVNGTLDDGAGLEVVATDMAAGCTAVANDAPCNDGNLCTMSDSCKLGKCEAGTKVICNDAFACTMDACDPKTGKCVHVAIGEGQGCDDGDACTVGDACAVGVCKGSAKVCGKGETCVAGVCKVAPDGMVLIPAGAFLMGCVPGDGDCWSDEKPQHKVTLAAYYIDVHEVTVAKYKACVDAGKCTSPKSGSKYDNWGKAGREQHPVNGVTWFQSDAYCKWAGGRLPTEAEWEKAARGGLVDKKFPWGDAAPTCTPGQANTAVWDSGGNGCGKDSTWPVGTGSSANGYGLYDMSGNVWEWVSDWYSQSYYDSSPASDPQGPASGSVRVLRGGSFGKYDAGYLRASFRDDDGPSYYNGPLGFRCSRSLP